MNMRRDNKLIQNKYFSYRYHLVDWSSPVLAAIICHYFFLILFIFCFTDLVSIFKIYVDPEGKDLTFFFLLLKINVFILFWFCATDWSIVLVWPSGFIVTVLVFVTCDFLVVYLHSIFFFVQSQAVTLNGNLGLFFFDLVLQINKYYAFLLIINSILFFIMIFIYIINIYRVNNYSDYYEFFFYILLLNFFFSVLVYSHNIFVNYIIFFLLQRITYNIFFKNCIWTNGNYNIRFRKVVSFTYYLSVLLILIFLCLIFYLYYDFDINEISRRLIVIHGFYTENFELVITFFNIKKVIILNLTNILFLVGFVGTLLGFVSIVFIFIQFFIFIENEFSFFFISYVILLYFILLFFNIFFKLDLVFIHYVDLDNNVLNLLGIGPYVTSTLKLFIFILVFTLIISIIILIFYKGFIKKKKN